MEVYEENWENLAVFSANIEDHPVWGILELGSWIEPLVIIILEVKFRKASKENFVPLKYPMMMNNKDQ